MVERARVDEEHELFLECIYTSTEIPRYTRNNRGIVHKCYLHELDSVKLLGERKLPKKAVSGLVLILLLIGMLTLTLDVQQVKASGGISIEADGSINPPTAPISTSDNVTYIFTGNISDQIVVRRNNTVVDGAGYTVEGIGSDTTTGIMLAYGSNVTVKNVKVTRFYWGIRLWNCTDCIIYDNIARNNNDGITLVNSKKNTVYDNTLINNIYFGIHLDNSYYNLVSTNNASGDIYSGILLDYSGNNTVYGNSAANSEYGIRLWGANGSVIHHNNFINYTIQTENYNSFNDWDDGYPSGGNYWSNYNGTDLFSGPYQNETGSDDIGDTPCIINAYNKDNYPLMRPFYAYKRGPQMDSLYIKYYNNTTALYNALKNREVQLTNLVLTEAQMDELSNYTSIQAAISPTFGMYEFDLNNNDTTPTYPNWTNPTAYKGFRQGIACLVNKTYIVKELHNYSYRTDTPIPRPNGDWWVDWSVSQYDSCGNLLGNYPYEFDSSLAAYYFSQAGFEEGEQSNPYYDSGFPSSAQYLRTYPSDHPKSGATLDPLIFYIRNDDPKRLAAGRMLRDNLRKMGIPVNATEAGTGVCYNKVLQLRDYHIYTGGWIGARPYGFLALYLSEGIGPGLQNYPQFRNATYDEWAKIVASPPNLTIAREAALKCQKILIQEAVCVWLLSRSQLMAYRDIYGVVNLRGGRIDNQWTFLKARLGENITTTEITYGLSFSPSSLNIVTDYGAVVPCCVDRIYDTLLSYCPYDIAPHREGGTVPWMAEDWEIETWESPYEPNKNLTKLTFYLRDDIKWHDGVELNSSDVKFTIEYLQGLGTQASFYSSVVGVDHVTTPNARTVCVYENVSNIWTLDLIGKLPILPKHIFETITNVTGYTPGAGQGLPANQTLIGSGPWKYVFHNTSMLYLEANREYFMETPPKGEVDFRYDWEMGCFVVDAMDASMVGRAYGSAGNSIPDTNWEPGCDIANGDCEVDMSDIVIVGLGFNATWGKSAIRYMAPTPTNTAIYVEHSGNPILVGDTLTVYVRLANFTDLSGLQFKLNYDNAKLDYLNMTLNMIFTSSYEVKKEINETGGYIWVSVVSTVGPTTNESFTLATIYFNATKPSGSILDLVNTKLALYGAQGSTCQPMAHNAIDRGVMIGVSTSTGTNVTVSPAENAQITFANVTSPGVTTLNITQPPSTEFVSVLCQDVETTANYTGNITIQFAYDPTGLSLEDEERMKIWLWNETAHNWVDITTSIDTERNIIYGLTPHLSIFGITSDITVEGEISPEGYITAGTPPSPPSGLAELNLTELKYFEITTTKSYTPPIAIRVAYDDANIPQEQEVFVQIWLWDDASKTWVNITNRVDAGKNIVHGVSPHLSIFGITSLLQPPENITITAPALSKTVVGQGYNMVVNFTVQNQGDFNKTFNVIVYSNTTVLATHRITDLKPSAQANLSFTWNTSDWQYGKYAISVWSYQIEWISVTIIGDVNGDFKCEGKDIAVVSRAYNTWPGKPLWTPNADINCDGKVEGKDVAIASKYYGTHYP